jgi:2-methylaconitate cis-trans-isomerase PrpF
VRQQIPIRFVLMRGGTSKAVFVRRSDLPPDPAARDRVILALFGSPDPRQVDGLGGADILTSKLAIIGPPSREGADLDYTFAQVSITEPVVDYDINCGNISAAVGVYAVQEGLVLPAEPTTRVRIHNTNTGRVLLADVPVEAGEVAVEGDLAVDGVPGTGAPIVLDYADTAGGATGRLLPSGRVRDRLEVPWGVVEATVLDVGNLCVFFPAPAAGLTGTEGPEEVTADHVERAVAVKEAAAKLLGLPAGGLVPIPVAVAPPAPYRAYGSGRRVEPEEVDLLARVIGGRPPVLHKAFPGTAGVTAAVAARLPESVVRSVTREVPSSEPVRIGHPSGVAPVWAAVAAAEGGWRVERAAYARTARRLAEGYAFVRAALWS